MHIILGGPKEFTNWNVQNLKKKWNIYRENYRDDRPKFVHCKEEWKLYIFKPGLGLIWCWSQLNGFYRISDELFEVIFFMPQMVRIS